MSGVNKVIIVGRLGSDPELKSIASGQQVAKFSVATSESWTGKDNQKQERTEWHRIIVWGRQAENCAKYLAKGRQVYIEGRLQTRSWEDPQGQKKYSTEIIANTVQFLSSGEKTGGSSNYAPNNDAGGGMPSDFGPEPSFDADSEIPF